MIKTKLNNPKEKLQRELNEQNNKFERIRKAYINGSFKLEEYLPIEKVIEIVFTLREYYNVGYFEATYYYDNKVMYFNDYENRNIVRIFPIEDYKKMGKIDKLELGVIYIDNDEKCLLENKEELFTTIPEKTNCKIYELDEETKRTKQEIEIKLEEMKSKLDKNK